MKRAMPILLTILFLTSCQTPSTPLIVYNEATDEVNASAISLLKERFYPGNDWNEAKHIFGKGLICPAGLWTQIKNDPIFRYLDTVALNLHVPEVRKKRVVQMIPAEGTWFRSEWAIEKFWIGFSNQIKVTGELKIRKLNKLEKEVLWAMIARPIEEPIFICEWKEHQILVFMSRDYKIVYIDELQDYIDGDFLRTNN